MSPEGVTGVQAQLIDRMTRAAGDRESPDAKKLGQLATEFESMLLVQMLKEMRRAGSWKDDEEGETEGLGAQALFDTLDVELASHLAKAQGFGLEKALQREFPGAAGVASAPAFLPASLPLPFEGLQVAPVEPFDPSSLLERPELSGRSISANSVNSPFGWRRDPFTGGPTFHRGVDLQAVYGEPVAAAAPGRVVSAGEQGSYGQTVVIEHGNGVHTRYAHLSAVLVGEGDEVQMNQAVGRAGQSGRATGTHVHFEVTQNGQAVDPTMAGLTPLKPEAMVADWGHSDRSDIWRQP